MAHSLEARVPFLDTAVASFAFSLPALRKVRGLSKKRLLRRAVEPLLPREIVHGRKRGFSIPAAAWLRGELEPFARETLAPAPIRRQGFLRPEAVGARARRPRRAPRGPLAPALGAARLHAVVRAHVERIPAHGRLARAMTAARVARRGSRPSPPIFSGIARELSSCVTPTARGATVGPMRVWIDMTAPAHPLVFRPLIERLRARGHEVEVTAREYAQTLQLLELHGLEATVSATTAGARGSARAADGLAAARARRWARDATSTSRWPTARTS